MDNITGNTALMPREKLIAYGASVLSDSELLAIFLRTGTRDRPVRQFAEYLLEVFGSLHRLLTAGYEEFKPLNGIGDSKFCQMQAIVELSRRYFSSQFQETQFLSSACTVKAYLNQRLAGQEREVFTVLFLNNQNQLIRYEEMFSGTVNCVEVHPREILRLALKVNAVSVILAHNHPSGNENPSRADRLLTKKIVQACELVGINVLDHLIVGKFNTFSFAEHELI
ncbi:RadC family protein [Morganella morganii]|uniref:RadC family protein n=1 Tax=Morganella morganii TaxID=582 RepID=UPI001C449787|nr:DNA repair protein RadC [Morganella morganii]QXO61629.1 DNA repair protein RadC [Morganella morganii]QXO69101.1 DNA repair protein RadC [Morganella morganii]